jgi:UDP-N-acetylmuramoyl-L-alanine---L-glutamate ligase
MRFSELRGRSIGIWGLGRETRSLISQCQKRLPDAPISVVVSESEIDDPDDALEQMGSRVVGRSEAVDALRRCDVLVRSPGVSIYRPELEAVRRAGLCVTTATSLWICERASRRVVGVTGTKGKSTTAALLAHLIGAAGQTSHLAGNIGRPVLDLIDVPGDEWVVVELSSYQIADLTCGTELAVLTNLFREHVDWHGSESAYRRDKLRLFGLPGVDACVLPAAVEASCAGTRTVRFDEPRGWHVECAAIRHPDADRIQIGELPLRGEHNAVNLCAALSALETAGIEPPPLPDSLRGFEAMPHRLQTVWEADGVTWVDDSISTTPESTSAALRSFPGHRLVLIAGGQDRGQDYAGLARLAVELGAAVLGLPSTGDRLVAEALAAGLEPSRCRALPDMEAAVGAARSLATEGTAVLLSPAAPSYNSYRNFEQRGDHFATLVTGVPVSED